MLIPPPGGAFLLSVLEVTSQDSDSMAVLTLGLLVHRTNMF